MDMEALIALMEEDDPGPGSSGNATGNVSRVYVGFLEQHRTLSITYLSVIFIFTFSGVIGNSLIIGSVCVSRRLRTTGNLFIVNLAIADFLVTTVVCPFSIVGVFEGPRFFHGRESFCHLVAFICQTTCMASMWNIGAIAVNRYICLCRNHLYSRVYSWRKTVMICFGLWVWAAIMEMPNFIGWPWGGHTFDMKTMACSYDRVNAYFYTVFFCGFAIGVPLVVVFACYLKIFLFVRASKKNLNKFAEKENGAGEKPAKASYMETVMNARKREEIKLAKTLFIVFVVFLCCWGPYAFLVLCDPYDRAPKILYVVVIELGHINSSLNSILYAATNRRFREGYRQFLSLCLPIAPPPEKGTGFSSTGGERPKSLANANVSVEKLTDISVITPD